MNVKITPAEIKTPKTKTGDPYLWVKTVSGKVLKSWNQYSHIWHLIKVGEEIVVEITQDGDYIYIVGVAGVKPQNATTGQNSLLNATVDPTRNAPNAMTWIVEKLKEIDKKLDVLLEDKIALNSLKAMEKEPKLSDLPVTDLPDLNS